MGSEDKSMLELTLISATDLKKVRTFGQDRFYVVVYIHERKKASSRVDKEGGSNPTWNWKLFFAVEGTETITVDIYSHRSFGNKLAGTSKISLVDARNFINSDTPVLCEVRRPSGKVKGMLSVSMKVGSWPTGVHANSLIGHTPEPKPNSFEVETSRACPPTTAIRGVATGNAGPVYSSSAASGRSIGNDGANAANAANTGQVCHPPMASSRSTPSYGATVANAAQVCPPQQVSRGRESERESYSSKVEEPVVAYNTSGYAALQNLPNRCGLQDTSQYHAPAQANVPYSYQQAYYAKPTRTTKRRGGSIGGISGLGTGFVSGALDGALHGDVVGDTGGW